MVFPNSTNIRFYFFYSGMKIKKFSCHEVVELSNHFFNEWMVLPRRQFHQTCDQMFKKTGRASPELSINRISVPPDFISVSVPWWCYYVAFLDSSRPLGDVFWNFVFGMIADVFGLSFSYLEHHPWLRFLVNKPEIATAPISCQLSGYLFIATQKYITKKRSWSYNETILVLAVQVE